MITKLSTNYIELQPTATVTGVTPDVFLVVESDKTGEQNFYFEIELKKINTSIQKYKVVPNEPSRATVNISRILRLHTIKASMPTATSYSTCDYTALTVYAYEYYGGSLHNTQSIDISVYDAYYRTMQEYVTRGYSIKKGSGNISYLRSEFNVMNSNLRNYNFLTLSLAKYNNGHEITYYTLYVTIGRSVTRSVNIVPTSTYTINLYNYLVNKLGFLSEQVVNADNIYFSIVDNETDNNEDFILYKSTNERLLIWRNELGGFSSLPIAIVTYATDTAHRTYDKGITYIGDNNDGARPVAVGVTQSEKIRLVSDWMDGDRAMAINKSLMATKEAYLKYNDSEDPVPLSIVAQNINHKSSDFDDLINVDITAIKHIYYV